MYLVDCAIDVHVRCDIDGVDVLIVNDVVILDVDPDDGADDMIKTILLMILMMMLTLMMI